VLERWGPISVTVADLRLYGADQRTPRRDLVEELALRLRGIGKPYLSVGLSRPFAKDGGEARHWLQINNIHVSRRGH